MCQTRIKRVSNAYQTCVKRVSIPTPSRALDSRQISRNRRAFPRKPHCASFGNLFFLTSGGGILRVTIFGQGPIYYFLIGFDDKEIMMVNNLYWKKYTDFHDTKKAVVGFIHNC